MDKEKEVRWQQGVGGDSCHVTALSNEPLIFDMLIFFVAVPNRRTT